MFCKWCGMESATTDQCSWCHRSFASASADEEAEEISDASVAADVDPATASPLAEEEPAPVKAPWMLAPTTQTPAPVPATDDLSQAGKDRRGVIGVRRPGGSRPSLPVTPNARAGDASASPSPAKAGARPPAPAVGVNRSPARSHTPAPATPVPTMKRVATPPVIAPGPGVATPSTVPPVTARGGARPAVPDTLVTGTSPAAANTAPPVESGGLAEGFAAPPSAPTPPQGVPQFGTFQAEKSKYYPDQLIDPVSGTHYDAATGAPTTTPSSSSAPARTASGAARQQRPEDIKLNWDQPNMAKLVGIHAALFAGILGIAALIAHFSPNIYLIPLIVAQFLGALLLPLTRVAPWADEDADDAWFLLLFLLAGGVALVFGPLLGLLCYLVLAFVRQSANPAVIGCLLIATLARLGIEAATTGISNHLFTPLISTSGMAVSSAIKTIVANWTGLATMAGWYMASIFRKFDE